MFLFALMVFSAESTAQQVSASKKLCLPETYGVPYGPDEPQIDGIIAGDVGWNKSLRYLFQNGTTASDAIVQGLSDSGYIYLSFEVNLNQSFNNDDAIVLVISPGGGAQNDRRIHIYPVSGPDYYDPGDGVGAAPDSYPRQVDYWNDSNTWNNTATAIKEVNPSWLRNNIRVSSANAGPGNLSWYVEMRIPRNNVPANNINPSVDSGINFPSSGTFKMYVNIVRVNTKTNPIEADERHWPEDAPGIKRFLETDTPTEDTWGEVSLYSSFASASCSGVSINYSSISTNFGYSFHGWNLSLTESNIFDATAYNDSVNSSGSFVMAEDVSATFKIANWGLGEEWVAVPADSGSTNPTSPPVSIPEATISTSGQYTFQTTWTLDADERLDYTTASHQCVLVELDSTNPGTAFVNKSAYSNMEFVDTSSPFERRAVIGTSGLRLPKGMRKHEIRLYEFTYNAPPELKWRAQIPEIKQVGPGQYSLSLKPKARKIIQNVVQPPKIKLPREVLQIKPGIGLKQEAMTKIDVQPGNLITIRAQGKLEIQKPIESEGISILRGCTPYHKTKIKDPILTGPNGRFVEGISKRDTFLLSKRYRPERMVGALIGSWDGFKKTSFVIGAAKTIKVPKGTKTLYLTINDTPKGFAQQRGDGYRLEVIQTPVEKYFGKVDSILRQDARLQDYAVPLGSNLPTYIICGKQRTDQTLTINGNEYVLNENIDCFGYIVKSMRVR